MALMALAGMTAVQPAAHAFPAKVSKAQFCSMAKWIVIGTVDDRVSYETNSGEVKSTIHFDVERVVHGSPPASFTFTALGGKTVSRLVTVSGQPRFDPDARYLLFFVKSPGVPPKLIDGAWRRLDETGTLPSNSELEEMWSDECE